MFSEEVALTPAVYILQWLGLLFGVQLGSDVNRLLLGFVALIFWLSVGNAALAVLKRVLGFGSSEKRR